MTELRKLRVQAKKLGIKSYWNKGEDRLKMEIAALKPQKKIDIPLACNNSDHEYFEQIGFKPAWLARYMEKGITSFQYIHKFRAFRCYIDEQHVDWVDINRVALDAGKRELCEILLRYQPIPKDRQVLGVAYG